MLFKNCFWRCLEAVTGTFQDFEVLIYQMKRIPKLGEDKIIKIVHIITSSLWSIINLKKKIYEIFLRKWIPLMPLKIMFDF